MRKIVLIGIIVSLLSSCTENVSTKLYGGTAEIVLEPNMKLINVTWKENDIWFLTKPMSPTDSAETYVFQEKSNYGLVEGKLILIERKDGHPIK